MDNVEDTPKRDNNDIEIVDLDAIGENAAPVSAPGLQKYVSLRPRFSPRQRRLQLMVTIGIVVLLLLVLVGSYAPTRSVLFPSLMPSTPTSLPRIVAGTDYFFVDANLPWGKLSVDNKLMMRLPIYIQDGNPQDSGIPMWLSRGTHVLSWNASRNISPHSIKIS